MFFKPWNSVKVTNENSGFFGQAGNVVRVETNADKCLIHVELDADGSMQSFNASELELLG
jgi:predicted lipoprotein